MSQETKVRPQRKSRWLKPQYVGVVAIVGLVAVLLVIFRQDGASYEEYLKLKEGMSRQQAVAIIGMDDYWHHAEGDKDVTSWVNKDGTYIKAVFDKNNVLTEVSWESGWNAAWEKGEDADPTVRSSPSATPTP